MRPARDLRVRRAEFERRVVRRALRAYPKNLSRAARALGISRPTLYDLMRKCGIQITESGEVK